MAKSRFEYVRNFELPDPLMPNAYIVVRVDGRGFHKFSDAHDFDKPNDPHALHLMDKAAQTVMDEFKDVVLAFGESDEYSFLLRRSTKLYNRRRSKINSAIVSLFTSAYVFHSSSYLQAPLKYPPSFDSRVVLYPNEKEVRDYFSWRQADTHINNLYNTAFWALVKGGQTTTEANKTLQMIQPTLIEYGINYNNLPAMYRKGSICVRVQPETQAPSIMSSSDAEAGPSTVSTSSSAITTTEAESYATAGASAQTNEDTANDGNASTATTSAASSEIINGAAGQNDTPKYGQAKRSTLKVKRIKAYEGTEGEVVVLHEDIIGDGFWKERPWLLL